MPTLVQDKTGIFFVVYSIDKKRVWRSTKTRNKTEAYRILLANPSLDGSKNLGETHLLSHCIAQYLDYVKANFSHKTFSTYQFTLKRFFEHFGDVQIETIGTRGIDFYKIGRSKSVSPSTINIELRALKAFFNCLTRWETIAKSPCDGVKPIRIPESLPAYLSHQELKNLLDGMKDPWLKPIVTFAAMTGARLGEIMNLSWENVNLVNRTVTIRSNISFTVKGGRMRTIPLNDTAYRLLNGMSLKEGLVFPGKRGGPANLNFVSKSFRVAVRSSGLVRGLHFHSLRHTFASLLVKNGVSLYQVQKLLGHTTSRITEIYAHLQTGDLQDVVKTISIEG